MDKRHQVWRGIGTQGALQFRDRDLVAFHGNGRIRRVGFRHRAGISIGENCADDRCGRNCSAGASQLCKQHLRTHPW
jgi:hypothetical protein